VTTAAPRAIPVVDDEPEIPTVAPSGSDDGSSSRRLSIRHPLQEQR
jgi:hypothetical protein